jgi:3-vinyl bacteriochlorophyllide hydratase
MHNLLKDQKRSGEAHYACKGVGAVQDNLCGASKIDSSRLSRWPYISDNVSSKKYGRGMIGHDPAVGPATQTSSLYTKDERRRRDASRWTLVQGVLAPLQFTVFLVSVCLVVRYLASGEGLTAATVSIVVKTFVLYVIMITGSLWEHDVYGRYLFAPAFFWEDAVSMLVLALHTAYLAALATAIIGPREQMFLALAAYVTYVVNATQFLLKLRAARLGARLQGEQTSKFASCAQ